MTAVEAPAEAEPKRSWEERSKEIRKQFPSIDNLDWRKVFDEREEIFAHILRDMLKVDAKEPGTPGPRPEIDYRTGKKILRQWMGQDYATEPFHLTLGALLAWYPQGAGKRAGTMGLTTLSRKTGIERSKCGRLLQGKAKPSAEDMEAIAKALGKEPAYFVEWRTAFVVGTMAQRLEDAPETTIGFYRRLVHEEID